MAKQYTLGELRAMSVEDRDVLYRNALKLATPEAKEVVALMIAHDLLTTSRGGLPNHHPLILKIEEIARSQQGRDAARTAADNGLPALAGVDPLLKAALGDQYGPLGTTNWAGQFVADEMRKLGYKQLAERALPPGCVARSATFFAPSGHPS